MRSASSEKACPSRSSTDRRHIRTPAEINSTTLSSPKAISTRLPDAIPAAVATRASMTIQPIVQPFKAERFPDQWPAIHRGLCRQNQSSRDTTRLLARRSEIFHTRHETMLPSNSASINAPLSQKFSSLSADKDVDAAIFSHSAATRSSQERRRGDKIGRVGSGVLNRGSYNCLVIVQGPPRL